MHSQQQLICRQLSTAIAVLALPTLLLVASGCSREPVDAAATARTEQAPPPVSIPAKNLTPVPTREDDADIPAIDTNRQPENLAADTESPTDELLDPEPLDGFPEGTVEDALVAEMEANGGHLDRALRAISVSIRESSRGEIVLVNLKGPNITNAALKLIKDHETILVLDIWDAPVTDVGLAHLRDMSQLRALGLRNTRVTNNGLKHLSKLTSLKELNLTLTRVTDAGMRHLTSLKSLHKLGLDDTTVTGNGINELQGALPLCRIAW